MIISIIYSTVSRYAQIQRSCSDDSEGSARCAHSIIALNRISDRFDFIASDCFSLPAAQTVCHFISVQRSAHFRTEFRISLSVCLRAVQRLHCHRFRLYRHDNLCLRCFVVRIFRSDKNRHGSRITDHRYFCVPRTSVICTERYGSAVFVTDAHRCTVLFAVIYSAVSARIQHQRSRTADRQASVLSTYLIIALDLFRLHFDCITSRVFTFFTHQRICNFIISDHSAYRRTESRICLTVDL